MDLLKEDNADAFTEIYRRYAKLLYQHAFSILKDRDETKEIIQEVFTSLWNKRMNCDIEASLSGYLYMAVRYQVLKIYAHRRVRRDHLAVCKDSLHVYDTVLPDYLIRERQLQHIIDREIDQLPKKMRQVFNMSRKEHLSYKEIAHQLALSEGTVKTQIRNALKILRCRLDAFLYTLLIFFFL
ncbi:RNA polymerase sigma-70 factor [Olivibacter ginsenosidimutans]